MLRQALADPLTNRFEPPQTLVEAMVRQANEQRGVKYFILKASEADLAPATEAELKSYYDKNPQQFTAPAYRSLVLLKAEPQDLTGSITMTDAEIAAAYNAGKDEYRTPERRTIQQLTFATIEEARAARQDIDQGTDDLELGIGGSQVAASPSPLAALVGPSTASKFAGSFAKRSRWVGVQVWAPFCQASDSATTWSIWTAVDVVVPRRNSMVSPV
jgi:hypothetical protein